jgi:hypothetical protein
MWYVKREADQKILMLGGDWAWHGKQEDVKFYKTAGHAERRLNREADTITYKNPKTGSTLSSKGQVRRLQAGRYLDANLIERWESDRVCPTAEGTE